MFSHIKHDMGFSENIMPRQFRTTILTNLYDQIKDIKLIQVTVGHTIPPMMLKHPLNRAVDIQFFLRLFVLIYSLY